MNKVLKAFIFAQERHSGQTRRASGDKYITHPLAVSYLVASYKRSKHLDELLAAALLHDTLEDTNTTFTELATEFTPLIASLVQELTSDKKEIERVGKNEYLKKKMVAISSYGLVLKLADRLHNIMDSPKPQYITDTIELMDYLKKHRKLTKTQLSLVREIQAQCKDK